MVLLASWGKAACKYQGYVRLMVRFLIFLLVMNLMSFWLGDSGLISVVTPSFWMQSTGDRSIEIAKFNTMVLVVFLATLIPMVAYCTRMRDD